MHRMHWPRWRPAGAPRAVRRARGWLGVGVLLAGCAGRSPVAGADAAYDVVILNGTVVDGSGAPRAAADIAIRGDRIAAVAPRGTLPAVRAHRVLDATDMVVAPGFIDILSQSSGALLHGDGRSVSKLTQGVTTEVLGEGSSAAPVRATRVGVRGTDGQPPRIFAGPRAFDQWLRAMEAHGISPNVAAFVGASTLRRYGMVLRVGPATPGALDSMRTALREAMEDGALGLGSALIYAPGSYASTEELVELARAMAPYRGLYITHMRSEADSVLPAIDEAVRIGREAGVRVEIHHLKAAGRRNWDRTPAMLARIEAARAAGVDVEANMYPYTAAGTGLTACLPTAFQADGKLYENLADPAIRARIRAEVASPTSYWENLCEQAGAENVMLTGLRQPQNRQWSGRRLSEVAAAMGTNWVDAAMTLMLSERQRVEAIFFLMSEENVRLKLVQPWMKFGSDAGGRDPARATATWTHPRGYGTYPRILGRYVRDEGLLSLETAIRKMTSAVAERLSLADRGLLRAGMYADVVIFDPATIQDHSTFDEPHQLSTGVRDVLVNGTLVVRDGVHTGALPGRALRGPGWRPARDGP